MSGTIPTRILPLPDHVATKITSAKQITSLEQVAISLLENALDAGSTKIQIELDFARGNCSIEDNGYGIKADDFDVQGGLCKPHHTSKRHTTSDTIHSSDGNFLTALSALCLLTVTSNVTNSIASSLSIHQGKVIARQVSDLIVAQSIHDHGTTVVVRDLFGNMPVRLKQRALAHDVSNNDIRHWQKFKHDVLAVMLAWPQRCSVRLCDVNLPNSTIKLNTSASTGPEDLTEKALKRSAHSSISLRERLVLLSQANILSLLSKPSWISVSATTSQIEIKGSIAKEPAPSKVCQFISLGLHPVTRNSVDGLYDLVNKQFMNSNFSMSAGHEETDVVDNHKQRFAVDRWPMFVLQIRVKSESAQNGRTFPHDALQAKISKLLSETVRQWLKQQGYSARAVRRVRNELQTKPNALTQTARSGTLPLTYPHSMDQDQIVNNELQMPTAEIEVNQPTWSMLRSSKTVRQPSKPLPADHAQASSDQSAVSLHVNEPTMRASHRANTLNSDSSQDYGQIDDADWGELEGSMNTVEQTDVTHIEWLDPATKQKYMIDTRTGVSKLCNASITGSENVRHSASPSRLTRLPIQTLSRAHSCPVSVQPLPPALKTWQPPAFAAPIEPPIRKSEVATCCADQRLHDNLPLHLLPLLQESASKLSRSALHNAMIIGQVDNKFILCRTKDDQGKEQLVLIDQHAASERIILEELMTELCEPADDVPCSQAHEVPINIHLFSQALTFEVSKHEKDMLLAHRAYFAQWAIIYDVDENDGNIDHHKAKQDQTHRVTVKAAPPVIAKRCRQSPALLIQLLQQTIWQMSDSLTSAQQQRLATAEIIPTNGSPVWIAKTANCPKAIIDLLSSRACRSAIMFNDVLDMRECQQLVQQLSRTAFPFICAHGRVSVVPIIELGTDRQTLHKHSCTTSLLDKTADNNALKDCTFSAAFRSWSDGIV